MNLTTMLQLAASFDAVDTDGVFNTASIDWTTANTGTLLYANWALRTLGKKIKQVDPAIVFTLNPGAAVPAMGIYGLRDLTAFSRKIHRVHKVVINGTTLRDASKRDYGLWAYDELERETKGGWREDSDGIPDKACQFGQSLILHLKPNATVVAAGNNYVMGEYLPATLTAGTDVPDLPEELYEAMAYLIRVRASLPAVTEQEAWTRLQAMNGEIAGVLQEVTEENERLLLSWESTGAEHFRDRVWL